MNTDNTEGSYFRRASRWKLVIVISIIILFITLLVCLNVGYAPISFSEILRILGKQIPFLSGTINPSSVSKVNEAIILEIRLPRVLAGALVGAALAASGVMYQGVFRNPMADSYLLGAQMGAEVGYTIAVIYIGTSLTLIGLGLENVVAFVAALITVFVVFNLSRIGSKVPVVTLLLAGMVANIFLLAVETILELSAPNSKLLHGIISYLAGGFSNVTWPEVWTLLPFFLVCTGLAYFFARDLNMLTLGDEQAQHLGVNTGKVRQILLILGSIVTAACVSISGPIGFVGLVIPHMTRLAIGPDHRILLPASTLFGAIFLVICDAIARVATGASELPVGVYTAIAGAPVFFYLLRRSKTRYSL